MASSDRFRLHAEPGQAAVKRARREADQDAFDKKALDFWLEVSGSNMAELEAMCERYPPITKNGAVVPGMDPEVGAAVFEHLDRINGDAAVTILRAMQRVAGRVTARKLAPRTAQPQLF